MTRKGRQIFREKGWHPSVAAAGDNNPSDATVSREWMETFQWNWSQALSDPHDTGDIEKVKGQGQPASDGHRNLVNEIAPGPLKRFEQKIIAQIVPTVGPRTDQVLKVTSSKVKVTEMAEA